MKNQKPVFSQHAAMKLTTPSLKLFKPTLATTLAIVLAWLVSVRPAQAGYTVTLQQVGPDVVAIGSGAINLTGLTFSYSGSRDPHVSPYSVLLPLHGEIGISTGPASSSVDNYYGPFAPTSFGTGGLTAASSGGGDMVGIAKTFWGKLAQCSNGLCLRYRSIGQRHLQQRDSCKPGRNTGHLRMEVGKRREPELHPYNPIGESAPNTHTSAIFHGRNPTA